MCADKQRLTAAHDSGYDGYTYGQLYAYINGAGTMKATSCPPPLAYLLEASILTLNFSFRLLGLVLVSVPSTLPFKFPYLPFLFAKPGIDENRVQ